MGTGCQNAKEGAIRKQTGTLNKEELLAGESIVLGL